MQVSLEKECVDRCGTDTYAKGGHIKAASYRTFMHEREALGVEEATRIAKLEFANTRAMHLLAKKLNIDCDLTASGTVDIIYDQAQLEAGYATVDYMNKNIDDGVERYEKIGAEEARRRFLCPDALGAIAYEAGSVSGYKLTVGILKAALAQGLKLHTSTPVDKLEQSPKGWKVVTNRGMIHANQVVLATNGYTPYLEPSFQKVIVPLRGQVCAQRPGSALPSPLPDTYTFSYEGGYEYMITRPPGSKFAGDIIIGGGWSQLPDQGQSEFGIIDDSILNEEVTDYLEACTKRYFGDKNWGSDHADGRTRKEWTGIMGTSADGLPYVGEVPQKKRLWLSASFNGHGMVLCLKSAEAIVTMLDGNEQEKMELDLWFPKSFKMTKDRLGRRFEGRRNVQPPPKIQEERSVL